MGVVGNIFDVLVLFVFKMGRKFIRINYFVYYES